MMRVDHREKDLENHDRGLDYDLTRLLHRRGMLKLVAGAGLAGAGLITLGACADDTSTAKTTSPQSGGSGGKPGGGPAGGAPEPTQSVTPRTERSLRRPLGHIPAMAPMVRMR
jgi:hypothetical protein